MRGHLKGDSVKPIFITISVTLQKGLDLVGSRHGVIVSAPPASVG
jgi:hypothetical protein